MFLALLRRLANDYWLAVLVAWALLLVGLKFVAPSWEDVALDGDLDYLPATLTSRQGEQLLADAFPDVDDKSRVVLMVARTRPNDDGSSKLSLRDRKFVFDLSKELRSKLEETGLLVDVWNYRTPVVRNMLLAPDEQAELVVARMTTGLMAFKNIAIRDTVSDLVTEWQPKAKEKGLVIGATGSTLLGGDIRAATLESLANTEKTTVILVLICLLGIYRAPMLILVPLATIGVSLSVAYDVVALMAEHFGPDDFSWSGLKVFTTTKIFVVVILFGAGTDYCLFLISRYKEELGGGVPPREAPGRALANVADALAGSAFTTILGLGTMVFADFGKFVSSGPIIGVCLTVALLACVTFAPALLRAVGPRVFWPFTKSVIQPEGDPTAIHAAPMAGLWNWISTLVMKHPGLILLVSLIVGAPVMWKGTQVGVTHNLLSELPPESMSVEGADLVGEYFGEGWASPMTIVAELPEDKLPVNGEGEETDLNTIDGRYHIARLHAELYYIDLPSEGEQLTDEDKAPVADADTIDPDPDEWQGIQRNISDVRSFYRPTGGDPRNSRILSGEALQRATAVGSPIAADNFVSRSDEYDGRVTQLSVVLNTDPFGQEARDYVPVLLDKLRRISEAETLPAKPDPRPGYEDKPILDEVPNPWKGARFELAGTTAGLYDLQNVTNADRTRIQVCVVIAVFLVLVLLLRRPLACVYLIITVLLSYWATIGLTEWFFQWLYAETFHGLDWKVPIFLFVILIAVGQDYNIYLTTRVFEEQKQYGLSAGLRRAIVQTGGIITSCGVIMAGTFISMATGSLRAMVELGFSLALGVLLDTFFVRTIIVPCYFAIVARMKGEGVEESLMGIPALESTAGSPAAAEPAKPTPAAGEG